MSDELDWRPPCDPPALEDPRDPRLGHLVTRQVDASTEVVIIGFPSDIGVKRNRGRPGACEGPAALRRALYRLTPDPTTKRHRQLLEHTADLGDLVVTGDLESDQERLAAAAAPHLAAGRMPVLLGGGHETSFGHFLAHVVAERQVAILNWDAHPDVRSLVDGKGHSGSAFRQALEHPSGACRGYGVAGLLAPGVAAADLAYLQRRGGRAVWREELEPEAIEDLYRSFDHFLMVSFDLDAVDQAYAPGVSDPATGGLTPELWFEAAYCAGAHPGTLSLDVTELNPVYDRDRQTARLAALTVWHFLRGLAAETPDEATVEPS